MGINKGENLYFELGLMVWTGLMGGGCYVNIGYSILMNEKIDDEWKELLMNLNIIGMHIGILSADIMGLIVDSIWSK